MKKLNIRIPENLQIILNTQEAGDGLIVKFNPNLWAIFKKRTSNGSEEYGYQLLNPTSDTHRCNGTWGLTKPQASRLINKMIKNPSYGFGKEPIEIEESINKLIIKIKKTYV